MLNVLFGRFHYIIYVTSHIWKCVNKLMQHSNEKFNHLTPNMKGVNLVRNFIQVAVAYLLFSKRQLVTLV